MICNVVIQIIGAGSFCKHKLAKDQKLNAGHSSKQINQSYSTRILQDITPPTLTHPERCFTFLFYLTLLFFFITTGFYSLKTLKI